MGIDGKRRLIKHNSGFAANLSESLCLLRRHLPLKRETTYQPAAHPSANLRRLAAPPPSRGRRLTTRGSAAVGCLMTLQMRSRLRPRSRASAITLPFHLTLSTPRSAGPPKEGALMCSKGTNLGPAQQSSAGLLHFERWQYAMWLCS